MGMFGKTPEEEARDDEDRMIYEKLGSIIIFPGSKKELEEFLDYECSVIDTGRRDKGLEYYSGKHTKPLGIYSRELRKKLVDEGIVALIHATPCSYFIKGDDEARYGIPVRKKAIKVK